MPKSFVVFTTLLITLTFITGCPPKTPVPEDLQKPELPDIGVSHTEANQIEPNELKTTKPEPDEPKPNQVEPDSIELTPTVSFHDKCADILNSYVDDKGMVDYKKLKRKKTELRALQDEFEQLAPEDYNNWPEEDKIAFWINAYNIQMLKIIVDNYPIESYRWLNPFWGPYNIRHIDKRIGGIDKQKFYIMKQEFTLARIEQQVFRGEFNEPRVFFAICQACFDSPALRNEPYYGNKLDKQLDQQVKRFLSTPRGFKINREKQVVYLSAILQSTWYGRDFIAKYGTGKKFKQQEPAVQAVLNFITNYISEQDVRFLKLENYSIKYLNYNWTLNDSSIRR